LAPSVSDVDSAIGRAQTQVSRLGGRLFELDAESERRASEAEGLRGTSAAVWQAAQDQIAALWACFQALSHTVGSIAARRQTAGFDRSGLWAELTGPSVDLGVETAEMARRYLPDGAPTVSAWAIDPLVEVMSAVLAEAAEMVTSVLAIREIAAARLDEIAGSLARAEAAVLAAGLRVPNELVAAQDRIGALREQLATDPMAVPPGAVAELSVAAVRIGHQAEAAAAELNVADEALDRIAGELHAGLEDLARARQGLAEVEAKIARPDGRPAIGHLDELGGRLAELEAGLAEARRHAEAGDRAGAVRLARALGPPPLNCGLGPAPRPVQLPRHSPGAGSCAAGSTPTGPRPTAWDAPKTRCWQTSTTGPRPRCTPRPAISTRRNDAWPATRRPFSIRSHRRDGHDM
jgi:hypothetical protein